MSFLLVENSRPQCAIAVPPDAGRVVRFAAAELQRYLALPSAVAAVPPRRIRLAPPAPTAPCLPQEEDDAFMVSVTSDEIVLSGHSDRAVLYASYQLLEQCGVEFWDFGPEGERAPRRARVVLPEGEHHSAPAFPVRSVCIDTGTLAYPLEHGWSQRFYFVDFWSDRWAERVPEACVELTSREFLRLIDWMGKHRLNSLFPSHFVAWNRFGGPLREAMADRGIMLEAVGHGLPALLPRELFVSEPELFCLRDGERHAGGNLCTSDPRALTLVQENVLRLVAQHPGLRILHAWADDVGGGSWCACPRCRDLPPYEQSMRAANAIADAVRGPHPKLLVDFLAYHDTSVPAGKTEPAPNLMLMYAPRQRCYAHPIGDPSCLRNREYGRDFAAAIQPFGTQAQVFEYHCDNILFQNVAVPLMQTIAGDQRFYHQGGARITQTLGFLQGSFWLYPQNFLAFARSAWDLSADPHGFLASYSRFRFGDECPAEWFVEWEAALRERIDLSPRSYAAHPFACWELPPTSETPSPDDRLRLGERTIERVEALSAKFRELGAAGQREVLALGISARQLRRYLATARGDTAAAESAARESARFLLDSVPAELRGGWVDWWARNTLGMRWP